MKFWKEFKTFINRGNILDLAVGVIIGSAFSAIVTSLTNKIIMPLINFLLSGKGDNGLESARTMLKTVYDGNGNIDWTSSIFIDWGAFITAIINFFLIALVLFIIIKAMMNASKVMQSAKEANSKEARNKKKTIKAIASEKGISYKEAKAIYENEQTQKVEQAKLEAEEKEKQKAEEAYRKSTEGLLAEIRDLLKTNQNNNKPTKEKKTNKKDS